MEVSNWEFAQGYFGLLWHMASVGTHSRVRYWHAVFGTIDSCAASNTDSTAVSENYKGILGHDVTLEQLSNSGQGARIITSTRKPNNLKKNDGFFLAA